MAIAFTVPLTSALIGGVTNARHNPVINIKEHRRVSAWGRLGWTRRRRVRGSVAKRNPEVAM